ncbi:lysine biosynthesis protein LysW [Halolamina salifodinae]|uniref:Alpha-aminoadipate carrier protein LysW n=1 Tax=Halolamina salifodinae TaxID=1202767 RepID=A0A8T4GW67_9EURY|nr:lysine biosynthesis protein LysW [Halolamina salifodinae]MBP1987371.1 alpha-aminoadipate carrier protein LysW [Halolamina salifodinae]
MTEADCVTCGAAVALPDDAEVGEIVDCGGCGTELEVVGVDPAELAEAPDLAEDWGE